MRKQLRRDRFRQWLLDQPAGRPVGRNATPTSCPLANYLNDAYDAYPAAAVYDRVYACGLQHTPLPAWAQQFRIRIDHIEPAGRDPRTQRMLYAVRNLTARECLDILDSIYV